MSEQKPKFHRWFHNFLIYFALWAYGLVAVIQGIVEIIFATENSVWYQTAVVIFAVLLMLVGLFAIVTRYSLAAFSPSAPRQLLILGLAAAAVLAVIHFLLYSQGDDESTDRLYAAGLLALWGIAVYRYYRARPYLFEP